MDVIDQLDETLKTLKDFQIATVDSVMKNFKSASSSQRVLVADEVGLGKTIVAKGVIAKLLQDRLNETEYSGQNIKPLRVTYICSNLTLAEENRKKLAVFKGDEDRKRYVKEPSYGRLIETAIEKEVSDDKYILEVCSLTPSTSFTLTQGHGNWHERLIIYFALIEHEALRASSIKRKLSELFSRTGGSTDAVGGWKSERKLLSKQNLDKRIVQGFHKLLAIKLSAAEIKHCGFEGSEGTWIDILSEFCQPYKKLTFPTRVRASIRMLMARACAKHLTADLFILDEFQRFKALLDTKLDNADSLVAREVFGNKNHSKILLLSATPFKAYSRTGDDESGNAHAEELNFLLNFISNSDQEMLGEYEHHRKAMQQQILKLQNKNFNLEQLTDEHKVVVEKNLRKYICRTERVQISEKYESLFTPDTTECLTDFSKEEIDAFKALDQLGLGLQDAYQGRHASQLMEFFKAAPWPLSFLSGYQFKLQLNKNKQHKSVKGPLEKSDVVWLSRNKIQKYALNLENAPHSKTRSLVRKLFKTKSEELLWVPPSWSHYPLEGCFENQQGFSKTILFSSWAMVPRALSGLISYEVERRLLLRRRGVKKEYDNSHSPRIKFSATASMAGWSLVYPSKVLMTMPLSYNCESLTELLKQRSAEFKIKVEALKRYEQGSRSRDRWYALAPMLLDLENDHEAYLEQWKDDQKKLISAREEHKGRVTQFNKVCELLNNRQSLELGPMPDDLVEYLSYLSIGGPAVSIARTWQRNWINESEVNIASAATEASLAVVAMFNKRLSQSIMGKRYPKLKYFKAIIHYCAEGGFQALMDEYGHLLKDAGLSMTSDGGDSATARLTGVLGFQPCYVSCQFLEDRWQDSEHVKTDTNLRCHYAVPLGNQKTSDEKSQQRVSNVRDAFNSPFGPFMLNSTSIGQEGLDFHWYCHNVVHWNIPGNPIDIEQREGRVNRYKSLVVRKRLSENERFKKGIDSDGQDPWEKLFEAADYETKEKGRGSDLVPYWHMPEGEARIERFVPLMPLSKDVFRLKHALKVLALYRLAFGQPRQEDLLEHLLSRDFSDQDFDKLKQTLVINLSPLSHKKKLQPES